MSGWFWLLELEKYSSVVTKTQQTLAGGMVNNEKLTTLGTLLLGILHYEVLMINHSGKNNSILNHILKL